MSNIVHGADGSLYAVSQNGYEELHSEAMVGASDAFARARSINDHAGSSSMISLDDHAGSSSMISAVDDHTESSSMISS